MIPLYPGPAQKPIKWRSLVQLITPTTSLHGSIDLLAAEDLNSPQFRRRRPSAPAVLQDLRRILPAYILRRHSSTALVNEDSTGKMVSLTNPRKKQKHCRGKLLTYETKHLLKKVKKALKSSSDKLGNGKCLIVSKIFDFIIFSFTAYIF